MSNLVVQTNVLALNSHRNLTVVGQKQQTASARLSSGYKINSAADDAAGLAISEAMRAQIRGLDMASKNAQDGQSMLQTAEGGLVQVTDMIQRVRELTVQSANDTNYDTTDGDRTKIDAEICQLSQEISAMATRVQFNHKSLLDGSLTTSGLSFQVGANAGELTDASAAFSINLASIAASVNVTTVGGTADAISAKLTIIDAQLNVVNSTRALMGALENRLGYTQQSLDISSENLSSAESRIKDADMAKEMMNLTAANVLQQAGVSMLSQANQAPQSILQLLR